MACNSRRCTDPIARSMLTFASTSRNVAAASLKRRERIRLAINDLQMPEWLRMTVVGHLADPLNHRDGLAGAQPRRRAAFQQLQTPFLVAGRERVLKRLVIELMFRVPTARAFVQL